MVNELEVNSTEAVDVEVELAAQTQRERDEELKEMSKDSKDTLVVASEAVVAVAMAERRPNRVGIRRGRRRQVERAARTRARD